MDLKFSKIIVFMLISFLPIMAFAAGGDIPGAEDGAKWFVKDVLLGEAVFWILVAVFILALIGAGMPNARIGWGAPAIIFAIVFGMYIAPWLLEQARTFAPTTASLPISEYVDTIS